MSRFKKPDFNFNRSPNLLLLLLACIGACVFYLAWYNSTHTEVDRLAYSTFIEKVKAGRIASVTITDGTRVTGKYKTPSAAGSETFNSTVVPTETLWKSLEENSVKVVVKYQDRQPWGGSFSFLIFALLCLMAYFFFRNMQGGSSSSGPRSMFTSANKSKARYFSPNAIKVTFDDVAGVHEAKEDLQEIIQFLKNPKRFERLGAKIPRGVLLCGAPGNGKTLLAKAVAGEANCPFLSISGSDFVEVFVGVGASRVRELFAQARKSSPCIVFIDEIDAVGRQRGAGYGGGNDEREQTLNQLLAEMDGFNTEHGNVIVLAATNRPDVLDKALMRPGRFDRSIEVPYPDLISRQHILGVHSRKVPLDGDVNLEDVARGTPGFSGADLENLVNEAALIASKTRRNSVNTNDFEQARDKIIMGSERRTMVMTDEDRRVTAYHEGGHTLLNLLLPKTDPFHKVTIVPRGRALGLSASLPERDKYNETKSSLLQRIQVCLGGMIVERMVFGEETTGASSDIAKATQIARSMVCDYGMSSLGPIRFAANRNSYLGVRQGGENFSSDTAARIDAEVNRIIDECYQNAEMLLRKNRDKLDKLAEALLVHETLNTTEVHELLDLEPRTNQSFKPEVSSDETTHRDEPEELTPEEEEQLLAEELEDTKRKYGADKVKAEGRMRYIYLDDHNYIGYEVDPKSFKKEKERREKGLSEDDDDTLSDEE